jgi:peptidoglycan/LPS O-acetylase OafA/YrhL
MGVHSATRPRAPGEQAASRGDDARPKPRRAYASASTGFAWLRFLGSLTVVIEHSGPILHPAQITIFPGHWLHTPGYIALMGFFAMSGYQISESWAGDPKWWRYMAKRVLRIWPPLLAVVLLTALVIGPLVTVVSSGEYWRSDLTWGYVVNNAGLYNLQHLLPGVFLDNPYPWSVNGSLWTLPMEFTGYLVVLVFGLVGVFRGYRLLLFPLLAGFLLADGVFGAKVGYGGNIGSLFNTPIGSMVEFLAAFVVGMILYAYADRIPLHGVAALALFGLYVALYFTPAARYALPLAAGYAFIVLAHRWPRGFARYDRYVYCSYGLYVWAFPLQQLLVMAGVSNSWLLAALSLPLVYVAGQLSWHVVELPTQMLRGYLYRPRPREPEPELDDFDDPYDFEDDLPDDDLPDDDLAADRREPDLDETVVLPRIGGPEVPVQQQPGRHPARPVRLRPARPRPAQPRPAQPPAGAWQPPPRPAPQGNGDGRLVLSGDLDLFGEQET